MPRGTELPSSLQCTKMLPHPCHWALSPCSASARPPAVVVDRQWGLGAGRFGPSGSSLMPEAVFAGLPEPESIIWGRYS